MDSSKDDALVAKQLATEPFTLPSTDTALHPCCHPLMLPSTYAAIYLPCHPLILPSINFATKGGIINQKEKHKKQTKMKLFQIIVFYLFSVFNATSGCLCDVIYAYKLGKVNSYKAISPFNRFMSIR